MLDYRTLLSHTPSPHPDDIIIKKSKLQSCSKHEMLTVQSKASYPTFYVRHTRCPCSGVLGLLFNHQVLYLIANIQYPEHSIDKH